MNDERILRKAQQILSRRVRTSDVITSPETARQYLLLRLCSLEHEVFVCLFLTERHQLITYDQMFRGTLGSTEIHPREVVKRALQVNAGAVIFAHNHPSGIAEPSQSDKNITTELKQTLALVGVRVLDHVVVGTDKAYSFAEHGLL